MPRRCYQDRLILYHGSLAELHEHVNERYFITKESFVECITLGRKKRNYDLPIQQESWWGNFYEKAKGRIATELSASGCDGLVNYEIIERRDNQPRVIFKGVPIVRRERLRGKFGSYPEGAELNLIEQQKK